MSLRVSSVLCVALLFAVVVALVDARAPDHFQATFQTSVKHGDGSFTVDVRRSYAPHGVDRFYDLINNGYFTENEFFRVVPNFVVQWGIAGDPQQTAHWKNANIPDDPVRLSNVRGSITFATAGPNTRTTQLFVNLKDNSRLDGMGFSAFGMVVRGFDVVEHIYSGYGEEPDQGEITSEGNQYLQQQFPRLDYITGVKITSSGGDNKEAPDSHRFRVREHPIVDPNMAFTETEGSNARPRINRLALGTMSVEALKRSLARGGGVGLALRDEDEEEQADSDGLYHDADHINLKELGIESPSHDAEQERTSRKMHAQMKQLELLHAQIALKKKLLVEAQNALSNIHLSTDDE